MEQQLLNLPIAYSGKRFAKARIVGTGRWQYSGLSAPRAGFPDTMFVCDAGAVGRGRPYEPGLSAAWRDMADCDPADPEQVVRFLRKHGDPFGHLPERTDTGGWPMLHNQYHEIAGAWGPPGRDGVSRILSHDEKGFAGGLVSEGGFDDWIRTLSVTRTEAAGLALRIPTLGAYMLVTAVSDWKVRVPMRHCRFCGAWMRIRRHGAHYCGRSCRSLATRKQLPHKDNDNG